MMKTIGSLAAAGVLLALTLPGPANAADSRRADGLTNGKPQVSEVSAQRRWRNRRVVRRYYRYPRYYPRSYAYGPYPYYYRPYYHRPYYGPSVYFGGPGFAFGFGY